MSQFPPQQPGFPPQQYQPQQPGAPQQCPPQQYPPQQYAPYPPQYAPPMQPSGLCMTRTEYCKPTVQTFTMKQSILALGDGYTIKDQGGDKCFELDSKVLSSDKRMVLKDNHGKPVAEIMRKTVDSILTWAILNQDQRLLATVRKRSSDFEKRVEVELVDGRKLIINGNVRARKFSVDMNTQPIATVAKARMTLSDTYNLTVNPGIDAAFIVLLTVLLDQIFHENDSE